MNRPPRPSSALSKRSVKSQTVIPRPVHDKAPANEADNSFATFSEWANEADEKAYGSL